MMKLPLWRGCLVFCSAILSIAEWSVADKPILIGALNDSWGPTPAEVGLRDGLIELGYREDKDFVIGVRFTQGDIHELLEAAQNLIKQGVNIIFTSQPAPAVAALKATQRVPIVFTDVGDPVGLGLVQSYARPGGNVTGVTALGFEIGPKRLELFQEMIPGLKRVLLPYSANHPYAVIEAKMLREAAKQLGIDLIEQPLVTQDEAQTAMAKVRKGDVDGIISTRPISLNIPGFILETAAQQKIPTMFHTSFWPGQGGLASYAADFHESGRMAARLVGKIIKGEKPANIPVEVNHKLEFVINLKTSKALGLTIDPLVLYRADRLIR